MKQRWIPAALMGCLVVGFTVGALGRPHRVEVQVAPTYQSIPAPASDVAPQPVPVAPPPIQPASPPVPELPSPVPSPLTDDGVGEYPPWNGDDLNCPDVGHPVRVIDGYDPHGLDRDGDGIGCDGE
ncbi:MAG TPA: hypothetical protein VGX50_19015 [Longimicrobium sp.]|jgi:hypothetical protein|nr:hypothetical protein [Longimicrobium sp.]